MKCVIFTHDSVEYKVNIRYRSNVRKITFRINNGEINVIAPSALPTAEIERLFKENFSTLKEMIDKRVKFENGANVVFLGKEYKLHIIKNDWTRVEEIDEKIVVFSPEPDNEEYNKAIYIEFLRHRAKVFLPEIVAKMYSLVEKLGADKPIISIRRAKTRWGSCRKGSSVISLNLFLMNMPVECIEYVVLHELVHIIHADHSREFWNTLEKLMPDYKKRKAYIDKNLKTEIMVTK